MVLDNELKPKAGPSGLSQFFMLLQNMLPNTILPHIRKRSQMPKSLLHSRRFHRPTKK